MFRSPSRRTVGKQFFAAAVFIVAALAGHPGQAQISRRPPHETSANRKARIAKQIADTYTHRWETGGGGGWIRYRSGEFLQKNSEIAFWVNTTYYLNQELGITGELRGGYGNAKIGNNPFNLANPQISEYPFMAGATYRLHMREHTAWSAFALAGTAIGKFDSDSEGIPATQLGMWPSTNARPAFSVGVNLDLNVYPNLAFRIAPSYLGTTFGGTIENNAGFEMGLVFRFGRQK
jgi:hypothetical protein